MHDILNPEQRAAVLHKDGALLLLAGAGAGKTRVVTHRIAELIKNGVAPEQILAVTFTNKAAREMKERVDALVTNELSLSPFEQPRATPFIGTFHALGLHIIRSFHTRANLPLRFSIFDRSDSLKAVKRAIEKAGFDPKELEPKRVLGIMGRAKGDALTPELFLSERASSYIDEAVAEAWVEYEKILSSEKAVDFDDILLTAYTLLMKHADIREHFQNIWTYIHVDEYQDTNRVQYELVHILAQKNGNIFAVGDADQNIYSWRGASLEHILNFEHAFSDTRVLLLTQNYRSTKTIIQAANDAIAKNNNRKEKELFTNNDDGEPIVLAGHMDEISEAQFVAHTCKQLIRDGRNPNDLGVLYRANFQSRILEEAFLGSGVPYQVLGTRFFERREIKDALAYIRLALNPENITDLTRIINVPTRGIGKVTLARVVQGNKHELTPAQQKKVDDFYALMDRLRTKLLREKTSDAVRAVVRDSGMWSAYEHKKGEDEERLENLAELVTVASKYDAYSDGEGIEKLLEEAALQSDQDEIADRQSEKKKKDGVKLMTVHAAKGLEFGGVFITGLEEGLFPHEREASDGVDPEEERSLFYVALTRAQEKVFLTYAMSRRIFGNRSFNIPSTFVTEMDPSLIEVLQTPSTKQYGGDYTDEDDEEIIY